MARPLSVDLTGKIFGRFRVIKQDPIRRHKQVYWICECECGEVKSVIGYNIKNGSVISCGCYREETKRFRNAKEKGLSFSNRMFNQYKQNARQKGRDFLLSVEDFISIAKQDCYWCGIPPVDKKEVAQCNGQFPVNGVDRLDNTLGYIIDNSVACCSVCNYAKGTKSEDEFREWILCVYSHLRDVPERIRL